MTTTNQPNGKTASAQPKATTAATITAPSKVAAPAAPNEPKTPADHTLPRGWDDIKVGSLVIAHESTEDGWWEAVVTAITGDVFTVRWRDYPRQTPVARSRQQIALLFTGN